MYGIVPEIFAIERASACKGLWDLNNGNSICYRCHKDIERQDKITEYVFAWKIYFRNQ
jgi:hypothetical protein